MLALWAAESSVLPVAMPLGIGLLMLVGFAAQIQQRFRYRRESALIKTAGDLLEHAAPGSDLDLHLPHEKRIGACRQFFVWPRRVSSHAPRIWGQPRSGAMKRRHPAVFPDSCFPRC